VTRIDDALRRRAGQTDSHALAGASDDVFVSAWQLGERTRPPAVDCPPAEPAAELRLVSEDRLTLSFDSDWRERLAVSPEANPALVEQFRRLAATLHHAQSGNGLRVIMLTSAAPNDGKTLSALNLALVLSESYLRRVLLIDADLRCPSLGNVTGLTDAPGLTDVLGAPEEQRLAVLRLSRNLTLLPAGRPHPDPMGMLTSARMRNIIEEARAQFDWVILDAPPVGPIADANLLSEMVDSAIIVVRAGHTQYSAVVKAVDTLGRDRIFGLVLNGVDQQPNGTYERYYYSGRSRSLKRQAAK